MGADPLRQAHSGALLEAQPPIQRLRYRRAPAPICFPEEAPAPETKLHLDLRTILYLLLQTFADRVSIGSQQFVYWLASDPTRWLAPDAFVRLGCPDTIFGSWKTWERGAPHLAVEIISDDDASEDVWADKLRRYHELGIVELVRFDPEAPEGERLRVWDRVEGDLGEREVEGDSTHCAVLQLHWVVRPAGRYPVALRLARDASGEDLLPTPSEEAQAEAARAKAEAKRADAAERRIAEAESHKEAAERRVAELEAELRRRG